MKYRTLHQFAIHFSNIGCRCVSYVCSYLNLLDYMCFVMSIIINIIIN